MDGGSALSAVTVRFITTTPARASSSSLAVVLVRSGMYLGPHGVGTSIFISPKADGPRRGRSKLAWAGPPDPLDSLFAARARREWSQRGRDFRSRARSSALGQIPGLQPGCARPRSRKGVSAWARAFIVRSPAYHVVPRLSLHIVSACRRRACPPDAFAKAGPSASHRAGGRPTSSSGMRVRASHDDGARRAREQGRRRTPRAAQGPSCAATFARYTSSKPALVTGPLPRSAVPMYVPVTKAFPSGSTATLMPVSPPLEDPPNARA